MTASIADIAGYARRAVQAQDWPAVARSAEEILRLDEQSAEGMTAAIVQNTQSNRTIAQEYLIRARNVCGTGSYGFAPKGTERISGTCP